MENIEQFGASLLQSEKGASLRSLADSKEGKALSEKLDPAEVEKAARSGDAEAIRKLIGTVLSAPEGRTLAEKLSKL